MTAEVQYYDGLLGLVRGVAAYFEATGVSASVDVGWTKRSRTDNQGPGGANRVVFIPGEFDGSASPPKLLRAGTIDRNGPMNHVGLAPRVRTLAWWHAPYTVSVWAAGDPDPQDEASQIWETKRLLQLTIRAMHLSVDPVTGVGAGFGNIEAWGDPSWTLPPGEAAFGRELTFGFVLLEPQFDAEIDMAFPGPAVARDPAA